MNFQIIVFISRDVYNVLNQTKILKGKIILFLTKRFTEKT